MSGGARANLADIFDTEEFDQELREGYVRLNAHPELGLYVACYTEKAVYENRWNDVTRRCRGLIFGEQNQIIAWCMPKFFNASEHIDGRAYARPLPQEPFKIYDKVDGSLGTVFSYDGEWRVATKGGFGSEQAKWAQKWLDGHDLSELPPDNTYVTEIIYPENRIVVNNGTQQTLTLLAVIGTEGHEKALSGYAHAWEHLGGTVVREYPATSLSRILFYAQRNQRIDGSSVTGTESEGYVIRYRSGLRAKVKFTDYVRLHGVITGLTERHVWDILREGRSLDSLLDVLPDEYHDWLTKTATNLSRSFEVYAANLVDVLDRSNFPRDPRVFRAYAEDRLTELPGLFPLYSLLSQFSWDAIRPAALGPWKDHE